jgi:hypothetical protein
MPEKWGWGDGSSGKALSQQVNEAQNFNPSTAPTPPKRPKDLWGMRKMHLWRVSLHLWRRPEHNHQVQWWSRKERRLS